MPEHKATIRWSRSDETFLQAKFSRRHEWHFDGGLKIPASAAPSVVPPPWTDAGDIDPEEAFVASLASCHMLTFLYLAAKSGFCVDHYEDEAVGTLAKNEKGAFWISKVALRPRIRFSGGKQPTAPELEQLHHKSHDLCFIANSVKSEVVVEPA